MRNYIIIYFLFFLSVSVQNVFGQNVKSENRLYPQCFVSETEFTPLKYSNTKDLSTFKKYDNKKIPFARPAENRMVVFGFQFKTNELTPSEEHYLVLPPSEYPLKIFLNGHFLHSFGSYSPKYKSRTIYAKKILMPKEFFDSIQNTVIIESYPREAETASLGRPFITDYDTANFYTFLSDGLGIASVRTISIFSIMLAFYFFFQYLLGVGRKKVFLYFALFNLSVTMSYFNNVFTPDIFDTFIIEKITRTSYVFFGSTLVGFFLIYTNKEKYARYSDISAVIVATVSLMLTDLHSVMWFFYYITSPYLLILNLIILIIIFNEFIIRKTPSSGLFFFTYLTNFLLGFRDIYYFAFIQERPFVLMTVYVNFSFILVIFWVLAKDHAANFKLIVRQKQELEEHQTNLELIVKMRTQDLSESVHMLNFEIEQHKSTQEKLREMNATKDKFFSIIAHDLKSPFNTLTGFAELLHNRFDEFEKEQSRQFIEIIHKSANQGNNLLKNLLLWARTETGRIEFNPTPCDITELIQRNIDLTETRINTKNITINTNFGNKSYVFIDENMVDTVIRNILDNAVKFTPDNGQITIQTETFDSQLKTSITDTGKGIPEEIREKLFLIDEKKILPGTENERGTGLGLVLCKEFTERNKGRIEVHTEIGKGTSFLLFFPLC